LCPGGAALDGIDAEYTPYENYTRDIQKKKTKKKTEIKRDI